MVGARVPQEWQQQISVIAAAAGRKEADRKEAEVVREALSFSPVFRADGPRQR